MAVPTGRSDKRIGKEVAVELARVDHLHSKRRHHSKRERSRDTRSDGTPLALRGPRAVKLSAVYFP